MKQFVRAAMIAPALVLAAVAVTPAAAQQTVRRLSLAEVLERGSLTSEAVAMALANVESARSDQSVARARFLPEVSGSIAYLRTVRSEYEGLLPPIGDGASEGDENGALPFGQKNRYEFGITASHTLFAGGRLVSGYRISSAVTRSAQLDLEMTRAAVALDLTDAYYGAVLADRLLMIAEAALAQAESTLQQVRTARSLGQQAQFEVLRAQVARDNQRPVVIRRKADRELAYLRLKQLLDLPLDGELELTTPLNDAPVRLVASADDVAMSITPVEADSASAARAVVRQAGEAMRAREELSHIARADRLPTVVVVSQYGRIGYPTAGLPALDALRSNWTVGVQVQVPLFAGGRLRAGATKARAELEAARKALRRAQELAVLDARSALETLHAAEASWAASAGTVEQATDAHRIAEVRYREGLSTQLELSDARLLLQEAQAQRAIAARDLEIARTRMRLLPDLPLAQQAEPSR